MPGKIQIINFMGIVLQYSFLLLLYYFLVRVVQTVYRDIRHPANKPFAGDGAAARLMVISKGGITAVNSEFYLPEHFSIGRQGDNDLIINDSFVSAKHAVITALNGQYVLADCSTNGTVVNKHQVHGEQVLCAGDEVEIGNTVLKFVR